MSASFTAVVDTPADPLTTWARVTDWAAQDGYVPLTRVWVTRGSGGAGTRFTGRTGIGPLAFDDPMEVLSADPPVPAGRAGVPREGVAEVAKLGRVVLGSARLVVRPLPGGGTRVEWSEVVALAPVRLTRAFEPLVARLGRLGFTVVLRRMLADLPPAVRDG
jgi:hypothetical protein